MGRAAVNLGNQCAQPCRKYSKHFPSCNIRKWVARALIWGRQRGRTPPPPPRQEMREREREREGGRERETDLWRNKSRDRTTVVRSLVSLISFFKWTSLSTKLATTFPLRRWYAFLLVTLFWLVLLADKWDTDLFGFSGNVSNHRFFGG